VSLGGLGLTVAFVSLTVAFVSLTVALVRPTIALGCLLVAPVVGREARLG
jgi:hypothetical protein